MTQPAQITTRALTRDTFVIALLAAICLKNTKFVNFEKRTNLYKAFHAVISRTKVPAFVTLRDEYRSDYDSLYSYSRWLEVGILNACQSLLAKFRDGIRLEICMLPQESARRLRETGLLTEFFDFASEFLKEVKRLKAQK